MERVARVENSTIPGPAGAIPVRLYAPDGTAPFPVLLYFHGSGWVLNNLDTHDAICRALTNGARCLTVSVDYRLAPENPFPAAVNDCFAAATWIAQHAAELGGDAGCIAVGGDSAGGNLSEFDPLRDEGELYAHRLLDAGVPVQLIRYEGMIHGFLHYADSVDRARDALYEVGARVRRALRCAGASERGDGSG